MKEIFEQISSYNLFNYLLPGVLFVVLAEAVTDYSFLQEDIVIGAFVYYFIGLIVSRFGSLIIEPFLKKMSFLEFADYKEYLITIKQDKTIEILSEANNMYRTFSSMFVLLILLKETLINSQNYGIMLSQLFI